MTSFAANIPVILNAVLEVNPKSVLDIGPGFGKYGLLIREAILSVRAERGDLTPIDDLRIECIEQAKYFYDKLLKVKIYDNVIMGDARQFEFLEGDKWDLVLLIDVVEHMTKDDALAMIKKFRDKGSRILISTPKNVHFYTEEFYGTDCPKHQTQWKSHEFFEINPSAMNFSTVDSYIFVV
jgi:2-polyprenyl-3-methyl-5-hydroxy-6-metoxy-1,4-benzoquinol methylase